MAANNPFSPFAATNPAGAPQIQGIQMPSVPMQGEQPSLMQQVGPKVFEKAISSDKMASMGDGLANKWAALTAAPTVATPAVSAAQAAGMAGSAASTGGALAPGAAQAILGSAGTGAAGALGAAGTGAATAAGTAGLAAGAGAAATAGGALAAAAPMAAALGPLGIPVLIGAGLMAAGGGK